MLMMMLMMIIVTVSSSVDAHRGFGCAFVAGMKLISVTPSLVDRRRRCVL